MKLKKRESKKKARKIVKKLTPEQKAKRKQRLKKLGKVAMWLNPLTAPIMVAKTVRDRIKARRAKRKAAKQAANPSVDKIIDTLQNVVAAEAATSIGKPQMVAGIIKSAGESVTGVNPIDQVLESAPSGGNLESIADEASEPSEIISEDSGELFDWAYAEGGIPTRISEAIAAAKTAANKLKSPFNADALSQIKEIENAINESYSTAKSVARSADVNDLAEVSTAIKNSNPVAIAASISAKEVAPEKTEAKPKEEKQALGEPTSEGLPKWAIYGGGAVLVGGLLYFVFGKKGSKTE